MTNQDIKDQVSDAMIEILAKYGKMTPSRLQRLAFSEVRGSRLIYDFVCLEAVKAVNAYNNR